MHIWPAIRVRYQGSIPAEVKLVSAEPRPDVNHYLKRAFVKAANVVVLNQARWPDRHVVVLYQRIKANKGHGKAIIAVARHLAESTYWILKKKEPYKEPVPKKQE